MKFKKLFSLSNVFVTTFALSGVALLLTPGPAPKNRKHTIVYPDLQIKTDTLYVTKEYFDAHKKRGLGRFNHIKNTITVTYWVPVDDDPYTKKYSESYNGERPAVFRHELEHARKTLLWNDIQEYTPVIRAEIACMNEVMACAAEVIECAENEWQTKKPTVARKSLIKATSAVLTENSKLPANFFEVDFANQKIADIVMKYAVDKYIQMFNCGAYKKYVCQRLDPRIKWNKCHPNKECNIVDRIMFRPEKGDWSQMFVFRTKNGKKVDIWKSVSQKMRDEVQSRVDSAIYSQMRPGEMLLDLKSNKR